MVETSRNLHALHLASGPSVSTGCPSNGVVLLNVSAGAVHENLTLVDGRNPAQYAPDRNTVWLCCHDLPAGTPPATGYELQALWDDKGRLVPTDANGNWTIGRDNRSISCALDWCTMNEGSEYDLCRVAPGCAALTYFMPLPGCGNDTASSDNGANATASYTSGEWRCHDEEVIDADAFRSSWISPPYKAPTVRCRIHNSCGSEPGLSPVWVNSSDPQHADLTLLDGTNASGGVWTCCDNVRVSDGR